MSLATTVMAMIAAGCSLEQIGAVAAAHAAEERAPAAPPVRSSAAERQARYRERRASQTVTRYVTCDVVTSRDVTLHGVTFRYMPLHPVTL